MRNKSIYKPLIFGVLALIGFVAFAKQEKVIQIFRNGEVIQEYATSDIDYIEVNDLISAPGDVNASVSNDRITITWNAVEGATYNIYRSPDNVNFTLLASNVEETTYIDTNPIRGSNFYRIKAVVGEVESGYTSSAAATLTSSILENGIYLGITGFNQTNYDYPILQLNESSIEGYRNFIDGLTMKNGTLLYYSVDQALNAMQATELPSDISTAAIVTFTDGLDQGSMMKDVPYDDDMAYLDALSRRIQSETVSGQPVTAFSIGIRGKDVGDIDMFRANLEKLASSAENATEVTSMSEVNAKFQEIAAKLSQSNYVQTVNLKMPGVSNGTLVRFTFDNVISADRSELYIEGTFNLKERSLENVRYVGMTSTSGTTIKGTVDGIFVNFRFDGVHTENNVLIKSEFTDEWTFIASNSSWQINSEFDKTENSDIVTERSSAVIMLVLDCSSSLADDFVITQSNAKDFINTLYETVGGSDTPGKNEETIYSVTPIDLSVAIWKDGTRYYLTTEQYRNANLSDATVEGLTVLSNMGNFIISPNLIQSGSLGKSYIMKYYEDLLPDKDQATVISARYLDINECLSSIGWAQFGRGGGEVYMTKTAYNKSYYSIYLDTFTGGTLYTSSVGYVRGVKPIGTNGPIVWNDSDDLKLSVLKDGKRFFIDDVETDLTQFDEVEGIYVSLGSNKFIISLHNANTGMVTKDAAMSLYEDILPSISEAEIISLKYTDINNALNKWGGEVFGSGSGDSYMTKTAYSEGNNYVIRLYSGFGGILDCNGVGYVRGVKVL